jgi:hypothetical protein
MASYNPTDLQNGVLAVRGKGLLWVQSVPGDDGHATRTTFIDPTGLKDGVKD